MDSGYRFGANSVAQTLADLADNRGQSIFVRFAIRYDSVYHSTRSLCGGFDHGSPNRNGSVCHSVHRTASAGQGNQ